MLYLNGYSTDIRKLSFTWKQWRVGIRAENLRCTGIFVFQSQGENVYLSTKCEISHCQPVDCPGKSAISPKVFDRSSKTFLHVKAWRVGIWGENCRCAGILICNGKVKTFAHRQNVKFQPVNCPRKMQYLQRYSTDFRKLSFTWKMWRVGIWAENLTCTGILVCNGTVKTFAHRQNVKFPSFKLYTVPAKCYISKGIESIFENFPSWEWCGGWVFEPNISGAQVI